MIYLEIHERTREGKDRSKGTLGLAIKESFILFESLSSFVPAVHLP